MAVSITFFTHGTTLDNEAGISSGWKDDVLSEIGVQQCKTLAKQTKDRHFDVVFTSDQTRAVTSARLTWGDTYPVTHDARLRECNYGDLNGKPSAIVEPLQEQSITTPMPHGESYEMVEQRVQEFLVDLRAKYDGKHVAIVAHKAPQLALEVLLNGLSWPEAFEKDWRKTHSWQPGWEYILN